MINNGLFTGLLLWSSESTANWHQLVGGSFAIFFISLIIILRGYYLFIGWNFLSNGDGRTNIILARSALFMFTTFIICDLFLPHAFMWQIFLLIKYSAVFLIGGSYLLWQYHRDLS
ncbi:DUF2178 domain-containing protein [Companilactobacillus keshanensis]|uniref:DUF2178 domain-containing protein n=1 Tax=Companilactobacillus keshanensis TaxID=2486003 RepID=A0ABW4BUD7_9LACO|nr:DUF2178 domain-containing protein [Companilactobacillus keshanensis]